MKAQLCSCADEQLGASRRGTCSSLCDEEGCQDLSAADTLAGQAGIRGESLWLLQVQTVSLQWHYYTAWKLSCKVNTLALSGPTLVHTTPDAGACGEEEGAALCHPHCLEMLRPVTGGHFQGNMILKGFHSDPVQGQGTGVEGVQRR